MELIWWLVVGLVAGWLAKLVVPGREPGGFLATLAIGIVGSLLGGWIWSIAFGAQNTAGSILVAFVGAVVLLLLYHAVAGTWRTRA
ncbi:MAG: GlsB/YeaQ/YmgE family stress response membrane protein [Armatimonadota bacterium]